MQNTSATNHRITAPLFYPPYEPDIDLRYPLHFDDFTAQHYHIKYDLTFAKLSRDLSQASCNLFGAANVLASADLVTAIAHLEHALNPFDSNPSPPYLRILVWEEHLDRWPRIHGAIRGILESCFPIRQYPVFAPQHVVRYEFWRPGDVRSTLSRNLKTSPAFSQGCAVLDCGRDMTLELAYRLRMEGETGRGVWYQYVHMHESWEPAIEDFWREGRRRR
ncbi:hypothetical protein LTR86_007494 [Recurvomyces mirabilis]|nr:hypothetical protein LTR86_007494 [Recurvomyces mirabilis]